MKVALGAAKGLAFLHSDEARVIYRDFKTSNILLDSVGEACDIFKLLLLLIKISWTHKLLFIVK